MPDAMPRYPHVMIDIETLGTAPGCAIVSIGAVAIDPKLPLAAATLYIEVSRHSCQQAGLHADDATLAWWQTQADAAREALHRTVHGGEPLAHALGRLSQWLAHVADAHTHIWAKGASFDLPILAAAYRAIGQRLPWNYRQERCLRTLMAWPGVAATTAPRPAQPAAHHALEDARAQARLLVELLEARP